MGLTWLGHRAAACPTPTPFLLSAAVGKSTWLIRKIFAQQPFFAGICNVNLNSLPGMTKGPFSGSASSWGWGFPGATHFPQFPCVPVTPRGPLASLGTAQLLPAPRGQSSFGALPPFLN